MAERKQLLKDLAIDSELRALLDSVKGKQITREQFQEQRISFAYGNAPATSGITKASVRKTANKVVFGTRSRKK